MWEEKVYSEADFESKIIDYLEHFLLELGKGFTFAARPSKKDLIAQIKLSQ